jgi:hypothetical protein
MKERITTPVAEQRMLNVGVPCLDLRSVRISIFP